MAETSLDIVINAVDNASGTLGGIGKVAGGIAVAGVAALGAAVVGVGVAAFDAANQYDAAMDALVISTGKSGAALDEMGESVKTLFKGSGGQGGRGLEDIAKVMGEVSSRLNLAGAPLEKFTDQLFKLSNLTGTDATKNVDSLNKLMGQFGVTMEDSSTFMDTLFVATQKTGLGFEELTASMQTIAPVAQIFNLGVDETVSLLGQLDRAGVDATAANTALRTAQKYLVEQGIEPTMFALDDLITGIQNATTEQEGLTLATDAFGSRAGPAMYQAIRDGNIDIAELIGGLGETAGAIDTAKTATDGWEESWATIKATITTAIIPLGQTIRGFLDTYGKDFADWFVKTVPGAVDVAIGKVGEFINFMRSSSAPGGEDSLIGPRSQSNATGMLMDFIRDNEYLSSPGNAGAQQFLLDALARGQQNQRGLELANQYGGPDAIVNPVNAQNVSMVTYDAQGNRKEVPYVSQVNVNIYGNATQQDVVNGVTQALQGQGAR